VVEDAFPCDTTTLRLAVAKASTPVDAVNAYVGAALDIATDPAHRALLALAGPGLPPECRDRLAELHAEQQAPLRAAVTALGVVDPALTTTLVLGVVDAASHAVVAGAPKPRVRREALALVHHGLTGPVDPSRRPLG